MALRNIILEGDDVLRQVAKPLQSIDDRMRRLAEDMIDTMYANNGIGLAAPQVGVLRRLFVIDLQDGQGARVFINPRILKTEGEQITQEGCLSIPGLWGEVARPATIEVEAMDLAGRTFKIQAEGMEAVCICHENDHLDGVLYRDRARGELVKA